MKAKFIIFLIFWSKKLINFLSLGLSYVLFTLGSCCVEGCYFSYKILNYVLRILKMHFSRENDI